ncbi:MAG: DcrB-related protein [Candidatus Absconditicoccaceae bacterium]
MIYTVSKKSYLIAVVLVSMVFLYGCNKNLTTNTQETKNNSNGNSIILDDNKKIEKKAENKSDLNIITDKTIKEDKLYQNKKEGFSLQIATGREVKENRNGLLVSIYAPQKQGDKIKENLSVNIDLQSGNQTIEEYYLQQKNGIQDHIKDFREISKEEYKLEKDKGIKVIYQGTLGINKLQWQQIIFNKNGKFFLITYTATQSTFDEHIDEINNIIKSFKF